MTIRTIPSFLRESNGRQASNLPAMPSPLKTPFQSGGNDKAGELMRPPTAPCPPSAEAERGERKAGELLEGRLPTDAAKRPRADPGYGREGGRRRRATMIRRGLRQRDNSHLVAIEG